MPLTALIPCFLALVSSTTRAETEPVLDALASEVERAMGALAQQEAPPYFLALELTEVHGVDMSAEEGAMQGYSPINQRHLDVDLRVGSPQLDSSHALRSGQGERDRLAVRHRTERGDRLA